MKILFCVNSIGSRGGMEGVTIMKANAFANIPGNEVAICFTDKGTYPKTIRPLSRKVHVIDLKTPFWKVARFSLSAFLYKMPKQFFRLRRTLQRVVYEFEPDVLITTGSYEKFVMPWITAPSHHKMVKVREFHFGSTYHKYERTSRFNRLLFSVINFWDYKVLSRSFDRVYLLTKRDKEENFPDNERFDVMYNPICVSLSKSELSKGVRNRTVLAVGRLSHEKNFGALLRIWSQTRRGDWKLRIVGDGYEYNQLQELARELHIDDSVEFVGWVENPVDEMLNASILCLTSLYEGYALVLTEGMSCGLPVISFDTPYGPSDIITDGKDGFLVDYLDESMFAKKLSELMEQDDLRHRMSEEAVKESEKFTLDSIVNLWMRKYLELLGQK